MTIAPGTSLVQTDPLKSAARHPSELSRLKAQPAAQRGISSSALARPPAVQIAPRASTVVAPPAPQPAPASIIGALHLDAVRSMEPRPAPPSYPTRIADDVSVPRGPVERPPFLSALAQFAARNLPSLVRGTPLAELAPSPPTDAAAAPTPRADAPAIEPNAATRTIVDPAADPAAPSGAVTTAPAPAKVSVPDLAERLLERLFAAGFRSRPPVNVHDLLDKLNLAASDREAMLERLGAHYEDGLGVNVFA